MAVESWSREELEEYYENPNLLIARANAYRSKMIVETLLRIRTRIASLLTL